MRLFLLSICLVCLVFSCKKEADTSSEALVDNPIQGTWELRWLTGTHMSPDVIGGYPPGNGLILIITDTLLSRYKADSLVHAEPFALVSDTCWDTPNAPTLLPRLKDRKVFFDVQDNRLTVYTNSLASGGAIETFARLK